ncbi:MAG TPA: S8 family serine peptidase [Elusimicrobiales bacterium]|nr:S8 family serine peptidase [Elusimicrobiales bacterium]
MMHRIAVSLLLLSAPPAYAAGYTDQIIVKFRASGPGGASAMTAGRLAALSAFAGRTLSHRRTMSGRAEVLRLPSRMELSEAEKLAARLRADPGVEYAEADALMRHTLLPNDAQAGAQWHYAGPAQGEAGGANLRDAWDVATGAASTVVAVIDTGILAHADLDPARILPGYDMISEPLMANDGDGRDADPSDPGDWFPDHFCFPGYPGQDSSWHGTHVAGTIGAWTDNVIGVAGADWNAKILPVRVLGRCGGYVSDIVDGIRWAAGLKVPGAPPNPSPARVINMSLGGHGTCLESYKNAIGEAIAAGVAVVVAAGNDDIDAEMSSPANCNGVITVAAMGRSGGRASYSNFGAVVDIAAPGGDIGDGVLSTANDGATAPAADAYLSYMGTSMAAPHVAGIASLLFSQNPALTPAQVSSILKASARPFPTGTGSDCTTQLCGAGIIDAHAALLLTPAPAASPKLRDLKAYPNPVYFDTGTMLTFAGVPQDASDVRIYIYNVAGELVRKIEKGKGIVHMPYWDGKNEKGQTAASGLYIYLLKTGNYGSAKGQFYVFR